MKKLIISINFLLFLLSGIKSKKLILILKDIDYSGRPSYPMNYDRYENIKMEIAYTSEDNKVETINLLPLQTISLNVRPDKKLYIKAMFTICPIRKGRLGDLKIQKTINKAFSLASVLYYILIEISPKIDHPTIILHSF